MYRLLCAHCGHLRTAGPCRKADIRALQHDKLKLTGFADRGSAPGPRRRAAAVVNAARRESSVQIPQNMDSCSVLAADASLGKDKMGSGAVVRSTLTRDGPRPPIKLRGSSVPSWRSQ